MQSSIAWLDSSSDEQRRVRELIALFADTESRDDLGIGQIRDVFSDSLFPGTSVIQTRARYFLFVPWIYRAAEKRGLSGPELKASADKTERRLIETLLSDDEVEGLIGRRAGPTVKILPSSIYWSGLTRYGILTRDTAPDQLRRPNESGADEADELATREVTNWDPTIPPPPEGFPSEVRGGFELRRDEADWLRERMHSAAPSTLLAHLVSADRPPDTDSWAPWEDTVAVGASPEIRSVLDQARLFSLAIHGAALLYNLLIGERYEAEGLTRIEAPVATYADALAGWSEECEANAPQLMTWDRSRFWDLVLTANPRVSLRTRAFTDEWLNAVVAGGVANVAEDAGLRELVKRREVG